MTHSLLWKHCPSPPHDDNSVSCLAFFIALISPGFPSLPLLCYLSFHIISVPCMDASGQASGQRVPTYCTQT